MGIDVPDLNCDELVELVTDYLEGALAPSEERRVEAHLERCDGCRSYVEQMRTTVRLSGRLSEADLEPDLRDALLHAFRDWRQTGEEPGRA